MSNTILNVDGELIRDLQVFLSSINSVCSALSKLGRVTLSNSIKLYLPAEMDSVELQASWEKYQISELLATPIIYRGSTYYLPVIVYYKRWIS